MGIALGIIGMLATIAGIVLLIIALVKKRGWGVVRSLAIVVVGIILFFVGVFTTPTPEGVSPTPPSETPPATSEVGKSRLNPVPFGSSLTYGDQRVTVLGSQQLTEIDWSSPDEGNVYLAVKIKVDFLGDPSKTNYLSKSDFDVVGNSGYVYEYEWFVDTATPLEGGDYYGGATTSGDLVYEISQNETDMVLIWHCGLLAERFLEIP